MGRGTYRRVEGEIQWRARVSGRYCTLGQYLVLGMSYLKEAKDYRVLGIPHQVLKIKEWRNRYYQICHLLRVSRVCTSKLLVRRHSLLLGLILFLQFENEAQ